MARKKSALVRLFLIVCIVGAAFLESCSLSDSLSGPGATPVEGYWSEDASSSRVDFRVNGANVRGYVLETPGYPSTWWGPFNAPLTDGTFKNDDDVTDNSDLGWVISSVFDTPTTAHGVCWKNQASDKYSWTAHYAGSTPPTDWSLPSF
jgi:hypothetical protein